MKLQITIDKQGNITIENSEVVGPTCTGISDRLAAALGRKQDQKLKAEYYELPLPDYAEVKEE